MCLTHNHAKEFIEDFIAEDFTNKDEEEISHWFKPLEKCLNNLISEEEIQKENCPLLIELKNCLDKLSNNYPECYTSLHQISLKAQKWIDNHCECREHNINASKENFSPTPKKKENIHGYDR